MVYEILKRLPTNDQLHFCLAFEEFGKGIMSDTRMWRSVNIDCEKIPKTAVPFLYFKAILVRKFKCNAKKQSSEAMPLNRLILRMSNLVEVDLSGCTLIFSMDFVKCTPLLEKLNVSKCPTISMYSMVCNLNRLTKLKVFICEGNDLRVSAYSIYQCVRTITTLTYLSCKDSGTMRPWIARLIMSECPNIKTFYFTTLFSLDTDKNKYEWYHLACIAHPHVEFTTNFEKKVVEYEDSCDRIKAFKKKKIHPIARQMV